MSLLIILFIILLFGGVPIAFVLGLITIVYILTSGNLDLFESLPSKMFNGLQNFGLVAIPMFILLGEIMNRGGITSRLIAFSRVIIGHLRGGLAYVSVLSNMLMASIVGSANAQTAIMSKVMVPAMEKEGYRKDFSTALSTASSVMGPLIPPSMLFIVYGVTVGVSVGDMFMAGIIPGILFAVAFSIIVAYFAKKYDFPKLKRATGREILTATVQVLPALLIPIILIVGIATGVFTPTESAGISVIIAIIIGFFFYKELELKSIPSILINTVVTTSIVSFLLATSNAFGWMLSFQQIPQMLTDSILSFANSPLMFLLLINVLLLIVGMFIEGMAVVILLGPIFAPIALQYGIDPVHLGVVFGVNVTIGLLTPPVGSVLFVAAGITNLKIESLIRSLIPFYIISLVILIVITYVSQSTLFIPSLFNGN